MKYIISGTGRSGTTLIHSVLQRLGVSIGQHEISLGEQGGVGGYRVIPNMTKKNDNYRIIMQVRDPVETVNSILKSSPSDFPDLGLYKKDYGDISLYTLNVWYRVHIKLMENSVLNYTLNNLNNGEVTEKLINLFNINHSEMEFNNQIKESFKGKNRNYRKGGPNLSLKDLEKKDSNLLNKVYEIYNKIENGNKKI